MRKLILVSRSPRRQELLEKSGFFPEIRPVSIDEQVDPSLPVPRAIEKIAQEKIRAFLKDNVFVPEEEFHCLGADTLVVLEGKILGKPSSEKEAQFMLESLSGREHQVITGYALYSFPEEEWQWGHEVTHVRFRLLDLKEIHEYIQTGEPFDKAGGYGIQGAAFQFVESYRGDYSNVVGLPVEKIKTLLRELRP